jgi:EAL domain-containing protein (putative c-di-GMP-specific phosphodiesterase class I)
VEPPAPRPRAPREFIPAAEECGLILPLGRWALEAACAEAASWSSPCRVAVNLSPAQFRHPDLPGLVAEALRRAGLPADRLELEVTEGLLIDDADRAREVLAGLKRQGVRVSLDDFGSGYWSGYSSLGYLRRFPFDKVKIDRCFVQGLGRDRQEEAIVRAILALTRSLRLEVTAEGVETQEQFELLRTERCHLAQGYLLGRPMSKAGLRGYLETADSAGRGETARRVRLPAGPQPMVHRPALANYAVGAN